MQPVYGVNTGFGKMASVRISRDQIRQLQVNLVRSHACGVGAPLTEHETRAMLVLRANAIAKGLSGVRPIVAETLCAMLNRKVHPVIPCQGSVGASGDLAPLAHLAQVAIGEGEAIFQGRTVSGESAMRDAKISPLALEAKEGLALLNGTQGMLALLALGLRDAETAVDTADVATALSLDALRGSPAPFDERIARARPYPGHLITARNLGRLTRGSEIRESHRSPERDPRVQDPYSLRCVPQVHGAVRDALAQIRATILIELNSATDNPLVFAGNGGGGGDEVISGGNFHGQPLAMAADQLAVALATLAGISERRTEQLTNPHGEPASGVSGARGGIEFRIHDSAGDGCGARQRDENAGRAAFCGFDSDFCESRGLRFDGHGRGTTNSADARELAERFSDRIAGCVPRAGFACAASYRA